MIVGVDTGFFFALEEQDQAALSVWQQQEIATSVIVLYELQKKLLQCRFKTWPSIIDDINAALNVVHIDNTISLSAAEISHQYKIPGLDSLILASLISVNASQIYTTDEHFSLYKKSGIKIINLSFHSQ
jgi:predicted nucleic acid-binding protein